MTAERKKAVLAGAFFVAALAASPCLYRANSGRGTSEARAAQAQHYGDVGAYRRGQALNAQTTRVANAYLARKSAGTTDAAAAAEGRARFAPSYFREIDRILAHPDPSGRVRDTLEGDAFSALSGVGQYGADADRAQGMRRLRGLAVSPSRFYRMGAAAALSNYPLGEASALLERLTHDSDPEVAAFAAKYYDPAAKAGNP